MEPPQSLLSDEESFELLRLVFPKGFSDTELWQEIRDDGWSESPFLPLGRPEDFPFESEVLFAGLCAWDIFSDNNDVLDSDGKLVGWPWSFRNWGAVLAELACDRRDTENELNYTYFAWGSATLPDGIDRTRLAPIYRATFRRLKTLGCDWRVYSFPERKLKWSRLWRLILWPFGILNALFPNKLLDLEITEEAAPSPFSEDSPNLSLTVLAYFDVFHRWPQQIANFADGTELVFDSMSRCAK